MSTNEADIIELNIDDELHLDDVNVIVQDSGGGSAEGTSRGAAGGATGTHQIMGILPPPPAQPINAPKINNIQYQPLIELVKEIGDNLKDRAKNITKVSYRLTKIDTTTTKITTSLNKGFDPDGTVVNGFLTQANNTLRDIEDYMSKIEENNMTISMNADQIENTPMSTEFDPTVYKPDITFIRATSEHKWDTIQSQLLERMVALDNAKSVQANTKIRLDRSSANSSPSTSPAHHYVMRSKADSLKPVILTYNNANLLNVKDHMRNKAELSLVD